MSNVWEADDSSPPQWLLTGHMVLWSDGSPAHVDMQPFKATDDGWESHLMISRSTLQGTRWLTLRMTLTPQVRKEWDPQKNGGLSTPLSESAMLVRP